MPKKKVPGAGKAQRSAQELITAAQFKKLKASVVKKKVGKRPRSKDHLSQVVHRILNEIFKGYRIEKEYLFHPTRRWRLDYAVPELRVGIEVHGGIWTGGRHTRGLGFQNDREKMNEAAIRGWVILELTDKPIEKEHGEQVRVWFRQAIQICEEAFSLQQSKIERTKAQYKKSEKGDNRINDRSNG